MLVQSLAASLIQNPGNAEQCTDGMAEASVGVVIRPDNAVLFIRRSVHPGDPWSGHMALPGGRMESEDTGPRATAIREVAEEVGLDLERSRCLGMLETVRTPVGTPSMVVSPFVFVLDGSAETRIDRKEVASVHWFGLERLSSQEGRGTFPYLFRGVEYDFPKLDIDGRRIWGMTLRIVDDVVGRLQRKS